MNFLGISNVCAAELLLSQLIHVVSRPPCHCDTCICSGLLMAIVMHRERVQWYDMIKFSYLKHTSSYSTVSWGILGRLSGADSISA